MKYACTHQNASSSMHVKQPHRAATQTVHIECVALGTSLRLWSTINMLRHLSPPYPLSSSPPSPPPLPFPLPDHVFCSFLLLSVSPFLSLAGAATSIIFVATKALWRQTRVCRDKTGILSRQNKTFVAPNIFLS